MTPASRQSHLLTRDASGLIVLQNSNSLLTLKGTVMNNYCATPGTSRHGGPAHEMLFRLRKLQWKETYGRSQLCQDGEAPPAIQHTHLVTQQHGLHGKL